VDSGGRELDEIIRTQEHSRLYFAGSSIIHDEGAIIVRCKSAPARDEVLARERLVVGDGYFECRAPSTSELGSSLSQYQVRPLPQ
jgi:hypothetical protein